MLGIHEKNNGELFDCSFAAIARINCKHVFGIRVICGCAIVTFTAVNSLVISIRIKVGPEDFIRYFGYQCVVVQLHGNCGEPSLSHKLDIFVTSL